MHFHLRYLRLRFFPYFSVTPSASSVICSENSYAALSNVTR